MYQTGTYFKPPNWDRLKCGKCSLRVEFAEANCAGGRSYHQECFCCSTCGVQLTANQFAPGTTVHAVVDQEVALYCPPCGAHASAQQGYPFDPYHTLSGAPGMLGTKVSTLLATTTRPGEAAYSDLLQKSTGNIASRAATATLAGKPKVFSRACPRCTSPHWVLYGMERAKCTSCGEIY